MSGARPFLTAEWRHLAMHNYEVGPVVLVPRLPHGVDLDVWNGKTLVSMFGFMFLDVKVLGLPIYALSRVSGLRQLFDRAYRKFARNRHRISASCGLPGV